jgi:hypothetical protein
VDFSAAGPYRVSATDPSCPSHPGRRCFRAISVRVGHRPRHARIRRAAAAAPAARAAATATQRVRLHSRSSALSPTQWFVLSRRDALVLRFHEHGLAACATPSSYSEHGAGRGGANERKGSREAWPAIAVTCGLMWPARSRRLHDPSHFRCAPTGAVMVARIHVGILDTEERRGTGYCATQLPGLSPKDGTAPSRPSNLLGRGRSASRQVEEAVQQVCFRAGRLGRRP